MDTLRSPQVVLRKNTPSILLDRLGLIITAREFLKTVNWPTPLVTINSLTETGIRQARRLRLMMVCTARSMCGKAKMVPAKAYWSLISIDATIVRGLILPPARADNAGALFSRHRAARTVLRVVMSFAPRPQNRALPLLVCTIMYHVMRPSTLRSISAGRRKQVNGRRGRLRDFVDGDSVRRRA